MSREERTGWRDLEFSQRRRVWGYNLPAVNIDSFGLHDDISEDGQESFNLVEYDQRRPCVLVEYVRYSGNNPETEAGTYLQSANGVTMFGLAEMAKLPLLRVMYWPDIWAMHVLRANSLACEVFFRDGYMSEYDYVASLYRQRNRPMPEIVAGLLNKALPVLDRKIQQQVPTRLWLIE